MVKITLFMTEQESIAFEFTCGIYDIEVVKVYKAVEEGDWFAVEIKAKSAQDLAALYHIGSLKGQLINQLSKNQYDEKRKESGSG